MTATQPTHARRSLWLGAAPLVLASKSASRRALLSHAAIPFESLAVEVDERAVERDYLAAGGALSGLAAALARAKALAASALRPDAYCLGADQTLLVGSRLLHKPRDRHEAADSLAALQGRSHRLTSAYCVARERRALVVEDDSADLAMRQLDATSIGRYLEIAGAEVLASVGVYHLEKLGVHLFERVEGDHATILGLPMLKLLAWLRGQNLLAL